MIMPLLRLISCSALRRVGLRCTAVRMAWSRVKVGTAPPDIVRLLDVVSYPPSLPAKLGRPGTPRIAAIPRQSKNFLIQLAVRRRNAGPWIQRSLIASLPAKAKSFRLAVVVNFAVNVQPRLLLVGCE